MRFKCGEGEIRTRGTVKPVRQFSKLLDSATLPPHQGGSLNQMDCKYNIFLETQEVYFYYNSSTETLFFVSSFNLSARELASFREEKGPAINLKPLSFATLATSFPEEEMAFST